MEEKKSRKTKEQNEEDTCVSAAKRGAVCSLNARADRWTDRNKHMASGKERQRERRDTERERK